ncbi:uncharacterized protein CCOS01_16573 [Colletotrichum costaricense]|uniref:Uncharacterized protein n=1 Tax=Colletotrichum costaricense TaxID=1209916 RepID=A0AAI9YFZ8_9PEZI|nr:uncharacterized protein CCOS01_16573 [Colletotrichum costaricense]KAK1506521.1 hypothetical protein CCOS01_16573 [Colletotrichum costaricense]
MAPRKRRKHQQGIVSPESSPGDYPPKRIKLRTHRDLEAWESWEYPPEFWDGLSKIEPTHRALKEFDRRTRIPRLRSCTAASNRPDEHAASTTTSYQDLSRFARHGGPDLSDLRGVGIPICTVHPILTMTSDLPPTTLYSSPVVMSSAKSSSCGSSRSADPTSTRPTSVTAKSKKSTPYSRDFDQHLTDHDVYPLYSSEEPDLDNIISDGITAPAKPDTYYGAYPEDLSRPVRNELGHHVIPPSMHDKLMAPNVFFEVKEPDGSAAVATRQARYDGAFGSRAMHSLQNYREQPDYDGRAYTLSSTYHDGTLKMNASDLAKQHRDNFIKAATVAASKEAFTATQNDLIPPVHYDIGESSDDFVDCANSPSLQGHSDSSTMVSDKNNCSQPSALPRLVDAASDPASDVASIISAKDIKRPRQLPSPAPKSISQSHPSKSRHPPGTARRRRDLMVANLSPADLVKQSQPGVSTFVGKVLISIPPGQRT